VYTHGRCILVFIKTHKIQPLFLALLRLLFVCMYTAISSHSIIAHTLRKFLFEICPSVTTATIPQGKSPK